MVQRTVLSLGERERVCVAERLVRVVSDRWEVSSWRSGHAVRCMDQFQSRARPRGREHANDALFNSFESVLDGRKVARVKLGASNNSLESEIAASTRSEEEEEGGGGGGGGATWWCCCCCCWDAVRRSVMVGLV